MFKATVIAALLAATSLAQAQTAAPSTAKPAQTAAPSAAKQALIDRVLELERPSIENLGTNIVAAPVLQMRQQIGALIQQRVPEDQRQAVARDIEADARKYMEEASPIARAAAVKLAPGTMGAVLNERFTEDELKQVAAFLESPVARKYQGLAAEFQRSMLEKLVAETRPSIEPKLRAFNDSVGKRLGLSPPAAAASAPKAVAPKASAPKK